MITRYRGDTHPLKINLSQGGVATDLSTVDKVEVGIDKLGVILVIECTKDVVDATGTVSAPFLATDLDTVGIFPFDIQITWLDSTKTTILIDKFKIIDDVNKT
jgi:hypothetical protein